MFERELKTQASHGTGNLSVFDYLIAWQYASITERIFRLTPPLEGGLFTTINFANQIFVYQTETSNQG